MPVMDGYEATKRIREQSQYKDLPIIAMTANVLKQDIERCLSSGMNDHIGKPIDADQMFLTISKWVNKKNNTKKSSRAKNAEVVENVDIYGVVLSASPLNEKAKLFFLGIESFYDKHKGFEQRFKQELLEDKELAILDAHSIKGLAATLGMVKLTALAAKLEADCKSQSDSIEVSLTDLVVELDKVIDSCHDYLNSK